MDELNRDQVRSAMHGPYRPTDDRPEAIFVWAVIGLAAWIAAGFAVIEIYKAY